METQEQWKDIKEYEGLYFISNLGKIKSLHHNKVRIMSPAMNDTGVLCTQLALNSNKKSVAVHRLVAEYFLPKEEGKPFIAFKDEDKYNIKADNLYWSTRYCSKIKKDKLINHSEFIFYISGLPDNFAKEKLKNFLNDQKIGNITLIDFIISDGRTIVAEGKMGELKVNITITKDSFDIIKI